MGSQSTTTQNNEPYEAARPLIDQGLADAQSMYNAGGFNIQPYQGQLVAGYDPMRAYSDSLMQPGSNVALQRNADAYGAADRAMNPNWYNPALQGVAQNVIADVMPSVNSTFAGSGRTGGGLHQQALAKGLTSGLSDAYYGAQQRSQDRALNAAGMVPGLNADQFQTFNNLQNAGQDRQAYNQAQIQADVFQDQQQKTAALNAIQDYLSLSSGAGSMFGVQTSTSRQSPGLMGMLGLGLQAAPFMFSDMRLKEDIKKVGKTDTGLNVYTYRYKAGGPTQMGVMAQDVEKKNPKAVRKFGAFKAVNYGQL